ncbi:hypothetical protein [Sphingorhabdus sp.]|jgi:hypothetical protein|uniref:hypothetical protein n=1 Tax=Sphingorhabdus sp. TaxID=1902408 RepID=UPI003BAFA13B|nr:hypothetical protein [Sphingomonadales bacterium]MBL0022584.1 hypothetical protein [Sphingomonadales bacterium]
MTRLRAFWNGNRQFALALIVLALAVRALVPTGYMVGGDAKGISVYVCDQAGGEAKLVTLPMGTKDSGDHQKDKSDVCAFAGLGAAVDSVDGVTSAPQITAVAVSTPITQTPVPGRGLAAPPPPATGPPATL